ncbi:MAG: ABC transporter permease [Bacteroidaceae bacterium]|nr:ABC transporter permease [Bacteroidaceae bacterium]
MSFPFYIARRYLFSKKSHTAINIISGVSVCGVAIATAALVCILSVFNGFQDMVAGLFTAFDPQLKILPIEGKYMAADEPELEQLKGNEHIAVYTEVIEDNALLMINNRQVMATIKGVDDNFTDLTNIEDILYGDGIFELHADILDYGVAGVGVLQQLSLSVDFQDPIKVYAPRRGEKIDLTDPRESFTEEELYSPNVGFMVKQGKYDAHYVITGIGFARRLFERQGYLTAVELRLDDSSDFPAVKKEIKAQLGEKYQVLDRYEQQEGTFKIMKIEKLISYIFLTFILMIACFNIIGSLSMLMIEKKQDALTLRNLGATNRQISSIFMLEGRMISLMGAVAGIVIGLALCLIQQHYEVIRFGSQEGSYIIDSYPVSVRLWDIILIFLTVIAVGFLSVWYPVKSFTQKFADK